jgi:biotin operon repressor
MFLSSQHTTIRVAEKKKTRKKSKDTGLKPHSRRRKRNVPDRERREIQAKHLARAIHVLKYILAEHHRNAADIAKELGVEERTIYRDIKALKKAGIPIVFDEGTKGYRVPYGFDFQSTPVSLL